MEKVLAGRIDCGILNDIFLQTETMSDFAGFPYKKSDKLKGLVSYITKFEIIDGNVLLNNELTDLKVYKIALKLANAIDKNLVSEIKNLRQIYGSQKEFLKAKEYLNQCAKHVWDIYNKNYDQTKVPTEAMKALGITNKPSLEFLLSNSLNYYEKDSGNSTVEIVSRILENQNLGYDFDDIFNYLKSNKTKYNQITTNYLCEKLKFDEIKLKTLGIEVKKSDKFKYFFKQLAKSLLFSFNKSYANR